MDKIYIHEVGPRDGELRLRELLCLLDDGLELRAVREPRQERGMPPLGLRERLVHTAFERVRLGPAGRRQGVPLAAGAALTLLGHR